MTPDEFKKLINEISSLIDKRAETTEVGIKAHVSTEIKASEQRLNKRIDDVQEHLHKDIQDSEERTKAELKLDIHDLKTEVVKKVKGHERRINSVEDELDIPHPDKN